MATDLTARLDRIEGELARLEAELEHVRALVAEEEAAAESAVAEVVRPAPPPVPEPEAAPLTKPEAGPPPKVEAPPPPTVEAPPPAREWAPPRPTPPPRPRRRSLGELAQDWDLVGARGFAVVGGAVLALGIGLFFVLAANRGWIGESARIALGAAASAAALGTGLWLRARFGQYWAALGAVGAGIAGAYATLAAATARYDLVPDGLGLPLAGVIAAVGTVIAVRWHSQVIAALGLLGAGLAPALQAVDTGLTWESVAFALIVLIGAVAVTVPRRWHELLHVTTAVVGAQTLALVVDVGAPADRGTIAVSTVLVATLLGTAIGVQLEAGRWGLAPLALAYALAPFGVALFAVTFLFDERTEQGVALVVLAGIWAVALAALVVARQPELAFVVVVSGLALTALGTAFLLSDSALTLAWVAEAVVFALLAARFADARLLATGGTYAGLASWWALGGVAAPEKLFDLSADHRAAVLPLAASAVALAATGLATRATYAVRAEAGLLSFVSDLRKTLEQYRLGAREALLFAGAALATLAASFALVSVSWEWGHIAATSLAALVGAAIVSLAGYLRRDGLAVAAFLWLGAALVTALAFDLPKFYAEKTETSTGGWALLAVAAALVGGAYAHRLFWPRERIRDLVAGAVAGVAAAAGALGVGILAESRVSAGLGLLLLAGVYGALAAGVFRRDERRDLATTLWSLALVLAVGAELTLVTNGPARALVVAATAVLVGAIARPLGEQRLWLAGGALAVATTAATLLGWSEPLRDGLGLTRDLAVGTGACAVACAVLAALRWGEARWRDVVTVLSAAGLVALLATERVVLVDDRATVIAFALTGGMLALAAQRLREPRVWMGGGIVVGITLVVTVSEWTKPSHLLVASDAPADGLWVLLACLAGLTAVAVTAQERDARVALEVVAGGIALYALSLGILEVAERISGASVETDFERGHTAVSGLWALVGLALLVVGLLRGSTAIRYGGLALFGLSLAKIFLYDLSSLSSVARAFSFILVGGLLLAGGFFLQRLSDRLGPPRAS